MYNTIISYRIITNYIQIHQNIGESVLLSAIIKDITITMYSAISYTIFTIQMYSRPKRSIKIRFIPIRYNFVVLTEQTSPG